MITAHTNYTYIHILGIPTTYIEIHRQIDTRKRRGRPVVQALSRTGEDQKPVTWLEK
jgi:hypothetical protein